MSAVASPGDFFRSHASSICWKEGEEVPGLAWHQERFEDQEGYGESGAQPLRGEPARRLAQSRHRHAPSRLSRTGRGAPWRRRWTRPRAQLHVHHNAGSSPSALAPQSLRARRFRRHRPPPPCIVPRVRAMKQPSPHRPTFSSAAQSDPFLFPSPPELQRNRVAWLEWFGRKDVRASDTFTHACSPQDFLNFSAMADIYKGVMEKWPSREAARRRTRAPF